MAISKILTAVVLGSAVAVSGMAAAKGANKNGRGTGPIAYVESQGLFYDSIVLADLPANKGRFQQLFPGEGPEGTLLTEFGPGDVGYLGGRWWVDADMNGEMDDDDVYFMCPLLGPGRENP